MSIDDLLARLRSEGVTPVTPSESGDVTPKPSQTLAVTPATSVTPKITNTRIGPRWPAVWYIRVDGKPVTMLDFAHEPPEVIERQLRTRFGSRLEHFELKGGSGAGAVSCEDKNN